MRALIGAARAIMGALVGCEITSFVRCPASAPPSSVSRAEHRCRLVVLFRTSPLPRPAPSSPPGRSSRLLRDAVTLSGQTRSCRYGPDGMLPSSSAREPADAPPQFNTIVSRVFPDRGLRRRLPVDPVSIAVGPFILLRSGSSCSGIPPTLPRRSGASTGTPILTVAVASTSGTGWPPSPGFFDVLLLASRLLPPVGPRTPS